MSTQGPKPRQIDPSPTSDIAWLDDQRRFKIPKAVIEGIGWVGADAPRDLVVEIVVEGHVRLWNAVAVQAGLASLRSDLSPELDDLRPDRGEPIRAFHDRYRPATLRPSDGRVQLTVMLHKVLEPKGIPVDVYVELGDGFVNVFSAKARYRRLRRLLGNGRLDGA